MEGKVWSMENPGKDIVGNRFAWRWSWSPAWYAVVSTQDKAFEFSDFGAIILDITSYYNHFVRIFVKFGEGRRRFLPSLIFVYSMFAQGYVLCYDTRKRLWHIKALAV